MTDENIPFESINDPEVTSASTAFKTASESIITKALTSQDVALEDCLFDWIDPAESTLACSYRAPFENGGYFEIYYDDSTKIYTLNSYKNGEKSVSTTEVQP